MGVLAAFSLTGTTLALGRLARGRRAAAVTSAESSHPRSACLPISRKKLYLPRPIDLGGRDAVRPAASGPWASPATMLGVFRSAAGQPFCKQAIASGLTWAGISAFREFGTYSARALRQRTTWRAELRLWASEQPPNEAEDHWRCACRDPGGNFHGAVVRPSASAQFRQPCCGGPRSDSRAAVDRRARACLPW